MRTRLILLLSFIGILHSSPAFCLPERVPPFEVPGEPEDSPLDLAQQMDAESYQYALDQDAEITATQTGKGFTLWWAPENFDREKGIVLVSLHGHAGWATRDFKVWHSKIKERGYAFLAVQWWYGRSMESFGYAKPRQIYPWIVDELEKREIPRGRVIFHGFSMGSANSYAVTMLDRISGNPYFGVSIANSGPFEADFPPNAPIFSGEFGLKPLEGSRWIFYCSMQDKSLRDPCGKMEKSVPILEGAGAKIEMFIKDAKLGHGGFMQEENYAQALDKAEEILRS